MSSFFGFSADIISEVAGLSASCMMVKRAEFRSSGGFDTEQFSLNVQDMDWCLRARTQGKHVLYTPYAVVIHDVNSTKKQLPDLWAKDRDIANAFFARHCELLAEGDPFFNRNLTDIFGFVQAPAFPGLDRLHVIGQHYDRSYWWSYGFPLVPQGGAISQRAPQVKDLLPFAAGIIKAAGCRKMVDLGCGLGLLVEAFQMLSVDARGIEGSVDALEHIPAEVRGLIRRGDLCSRDDLAWLREQRPFDVATCLEVLEHLPMDQIDRVIANLTELSDVVIVTTPQPNRWDHDDPTHLCVMPRPFWVKRFQNAGFKEDKEMGNRIFGNGYQSYPDTNAFVFVRAN